MKTARNVLLGFNLGTVTGTIVLVLFLTYTLLPISLNAGTTGNYNTITHLYWCANPWSCAHERGHALDQSLGWPSQSDKFTFAIQVFLVANLGDRDTDRLAARILRFPGLIQPAPRMGFDGRMELYATLYADAWEKIDKVPESFRKFYLAGWKE